MKTSSPPVLLAGPFEICRRLLPALKEVTPLPCDTLDEAVKRLQESQPRLVVVCYAFDHMRPFRLIQYLRSDWNGPRLPIYLLQVLDWHLGATEQKQMRESYESLGVDKFINFCEDTKVDGEDVALQRFRAAVIDQLGLAQVQGAPGTSARRPR